MTQTREGLIEAMAAAVLAEFDGGASGLDEMAAAIARAHARAALAAIEEHAAVVPREPTREMLRAMCKRRGIDGDKEPTDILDNAAIISMGESIADYCVMISASPFARGGGDE